LYLGGGGEEENESHANRLVSQSVSQPDRSEIAASATMGELQDGSPGIMLILADQYDNISKGNSKNAVN
jgi:hypothetical protein